jgi:hypothetical protein
MKKRTFLLITILTIGYLQSCISTTVNPEITKSELYNHINYLASESLKGRYPGTVEDKLAAEYISNQYKKYGLELLFTDGLQAFEISNKLKLGSNNILQLEGENYSIKDDFIPISFSSNAEQESEIVFVGYGFNIKGDDFSWNDYSNIDVKGKWVLILRGEPTKSDVSIPFGMYSSLRSKATVAKDAGAAGVLFVSGENFEKEDNLISLEKPEGNINIPVVNIKRELANKIINKKGKTISTIESEIDNGNYFQSFLTNTSLKCSTDIIPDSKTTYNIAAQLITDKNNPKFIVIGAHYDHLGYGGVGSGSRAPNEHAIHYGADDNASGVSSVLEIAEKLASVKDNLNTNFIFVAFGAEEMGLIGSKYFTNNLPFEDSLILSMINIDMVGRLKDDNSLQISGVGTSLEGESILEKLNSEYKFRLGLSKEGYGPSDHSSFYSKNIPVFFFSTGAHMDYHTPGDSIGSINFNGLFQVTNYIYDFAYNLSSQNTLLTFQEAGPKMPKEGQARTSLKVTLGIMPDFTGVVKNGLRADIVIEGKPAYKAGMLSGDIITAIDGNSVSDIYEYMERLSKLKAEQIITVEVIRDEKKEVLIVQL